MLYIIHSEKFSSILFNLISIARACPVNPSDLAIADAALPIFVSVSRFRLIIGIVLRKCLTPKAEEYLEVPPVGITWLGPAI